MSVAENKAIARRFIEEVWNQGRLEAVDELLAPDLVNHEAGGGTSTGRDAFKRFIGEFRAAYPAVRFTIEDMLGEGDEVATRVTIRSGNGVRVEAWTGIGIVRVVEGRIVEQWANTDLVGAAARQLGAGPS